MKAAITVYKEHPTALKYEERASEKRAKEAEKAAVAEAKAAAKAEREAERQAKLDEKEAVKAAKEEERVRVAEEKAAAERAEAEAAEAARVEEARCPIELQGWRIEGHALVGKRLAFYGNGGGEAEEVYTLGRVVRWMEGKEDGNGGGRASRFHVFYDNGMEGEVTEAAAKAGNDLFEGLEDDVVDTAGVAALSDLVQPKYTNHLIRKGLRVEPSHFGRGVRAELGSWRRACAKV